MIEKLDAMPILVDACPSFRGAWQAHVSDFGNDVHFVAAGEFALHLLDLIGAGDVSTFPAVGIALERLLVDGSPSVQELAVVGVLEGVQNTWSNKGVDPERFFPFLGKKGADAWTELNIFWSGNAK